MEPLAQSPGTVSKILWHFTGGPGWNAAENRQNPDPKPPAEAFEILKSILRERKLRLSSYSEVVQVRLTLPEHDKVTKKIVGLREEVKSLNSSPVCCLADVPIIHLAYPAKRYGRFAIGFHRKAAIDKGFNPVFYVLDKAKAITSIHQGIGILDKAVPDSMYMLQFCVDAVKEEVSKLKVDGFDVSTSLEFLDNIIPSYVQEIDKAVSTTHKVFQDFLGLVKTFTQNDFGTIYCEREWRSLADFNFKHEDIAMIVIPRKMDKTEYFQPFVDAVSRAPLFLPRSIPIVPWEDLIEH